MDAEVYNGKLSTFLQEIAKVDEALKSFKKEDVSGADKETCFAELNKVQRALDNCDDMMLEFIYLELKEDDPVDKARSISLRNMSDELLKRVKLHSKEIKTEMSRLLSNGDRRFMTPEERKKDEDQELECKRLRAELDKKKAERERLEKENEKKAEKIMGKFMIRINDCSRNADRLVNEYDEEKSDVWLDRYENLCQVMENLLLEIFDVNIEILDLGLLEVKWNAADQKSIDVLKAKCNCLSELEIFGKRVSKNAALVQYRSKWLTHNKEENTSNDKNDAFLNVPIALIMKILASA